MNEVSARSNTRAFLLLSVWAANLGASVLLFRIGTPVAIVFAELFLALFLFQNFILLHEAGHGAFFRTRFLHPVLGNLTGFLAGIPYASWKPIHSLHHVWTGYRDRDPTTEKTFVELLKPRQRGIIAFCWRYWIPIFTLGYRIGIFWNSEKLRRHLSPEAYARARRAMGIHLILYAALIATFGTSLFLILPAILMSFVLSDLVTLSQHSHIRMEHSGGKDVSPVPTRNQVKYTRSLLAPRIVSNYLFFNFNLHEAHHAAPAWPCYRLEHVELPETRGIASPIVRYVREAKRMNGVDFIFDSRPDCPF